MGCREIEYTLNYETISPSVIPHLMRDPDPPSSLRNLDSRLRGNDRKKSFVIQRNIESSSWVRRRQDDFPIPPKFSLLYPIYCFGGFCQSNRRSCRMVSAIRFLVSPRKYSYCLVLNMFLILSKNTSKEGLSIMRGSICSLVPLRG